MTRKHWLDATRTSSQSSVVSSDALGSVVSDQLSPCSVSSWVILAASSRASDGRYDTEYVSAAPRGSCTFARAGLAWSMAHAARGFVWVCLLASGKAMI